MLAAGGCGMHRVPDMPTGVREVVPNNLAARAQLADHPP